MSQKNLFRLVTKLSWERKVTPERLLRQGEGEKITFAEEHLKVKKTPQNLTALLIDIPPNQRPFALAVFDRFVVLLFLAIKCC